MSSLAVPLASSHIKGLKLSEESARKALTLARKEESDAKAAVDECLGEVDALQAKIQDSMAKRFRLLDAHMAKMEARVRLEKTHESAAQTLRKAVI